MARKPRARRRARQAETVRIRQGAQWESGQRQDDLGEEILEAAERFAFEARTAARKMHGHAAHVSGNLAGRNDDSLSRAMRATAMVFQLVFWLTLALIVLVLLPVIIPTAKAFYHASLSILSPFLWQLAFVAFILGFLALLFAALWAVRAIRRRKWERR